MWTVTIRAEEWAMFLVRGFIHQDSFTADPAVFANVRPDLERLRVLLKDPQAAWAEYQAYCDRLDPDRGKIGERLTEERFLSAMKGQLGRWRRRERKEEQLEAKRRAQGLVVLDAEAPDFADRLFGERRRLGIPSGRY